MMHVCCVWAACMLHLCCIPTALFSDEVLQPWASITRHIASPLAVQQAVPETNPALNTTPHNVKACGRGGTALSSGIHRMSGRGPAHSVLCMQFAAVYGCGNAAVGHALAACGVVSCVAVRGGAVCAVCAVCALLRECVLRGIVCWNAARSPLAFCHSDAEDQFRLCIISS